MLTSRLPIIALGLTLGALHGCTGEEAPVRCFVGDPAQPPELEAIYRGVDRTIHPITEGGAVPLILPPQGGKVMIVGVRVRNMDGCPLTISTSLRDVCDESIVALERRPVTLTEGSDGWLEPLQPAELSNYSNLPACPRSNLLRDIHGQPYRLSIKVEDKDGRLAETSVEVVPVCAEAEVKDRCECECAQSYSLGQECSGMDAGTSTVSGCPGDL